VSDQPVPEVPVPDAPGPDSAGPASRGAPQRPQPPEADLLTLSEQLVAVPSPSGDEGPLVDWLEAELRAVPGLTVDRVGDNVVARTALGRDQRVILAGHSDTVPANGNAVPRREGDTLWGLGAADMKGGLAVMVDLARTVVEPAVDVTYVFYAREEIAAAESGLLELQEARPDLLVGDLAVLGEPTDGVLEAGCQGTLRARITLVGRRAHSARPWMGDNAIHRAAPLLACLAEHRERRPVLAGCEFREALQAVAIEGGVAGNVVPDRLELVVNHRFAPDRSPEQAVEHVRAMCADVLGPDDRFEVTELAGGAPPAVDHPLLADLVARSGLSVRAKLGWTDVARFAALGVPAVNLGPGDPLLAHTAEERVQRPALDSVRATLHMLLGHR
jgi:succinyl-diaminopimelate desuccinylase